MGSTSDKIKGTTNEVAGKARVRRSARPRIIKKSRQRAAFRKPRARPRLPRVRPRKPLRRSSTRRSQKQYRHLDWAHARRGLFPRKRGLKVITFATTVVTLGLLSGNAFAQAAEDPAVNSCKSSAFSLFRNGRRISQIWSWTWKAWHQQGHTKVEDVSVKTAFLAKRHRTQGKDQQAGPVRLPAWRGSRRRRRQSR